MPTFLIRIALFLSISVSAFCADSEFQEVKKLAEQQKFEAALQKTRGLIEVARKKKNDHFLAEALIQATQLEMALHGYETAVRFLKESAWPKDGLERVLLHLYYARALMTYQNSYSWEISQREENASGAPLDLKSWTTRQIGLEIDRSFDAAMMEGPWLGKTIPVSFRDYLVPNSFPEGVRPYLRDAITYLAVEHFRNTQYWSAQESGELYKLRAEKIAVKIFSKRIPAISRESHPLEKLASWLGELQTRHAADSEAALEARYVLLEQLHDSFSEATDKNAVRNVLISFQKKAVRKPWWSRGQALLAGFFLKDESPGGRILAREEAIKGRDAFLKSAGSEMCASILFEIERPELNMTGMRTDGASRRSILLTYRNLRKLYFRAYRISMEEQFRAKGANPFQIESMRAQKLISLGSPVAKWSVDLPEAKDFSHHRHFVTPPELASGFYGIAVSLQENFSRENNIVQMAPFMVTKLVLASQNLDGGSREAKVLDGASGKPLRNVNVSLYSWDWQNPPVLMETVSTGADGLATIREKMENRNFFLLAKSGDDLAFEENVYFPRPSDLASITSSFVFTDRSIYRPQQKILFKVVAYSGNPSTASYSVAREGETIEVRLLDPNHQEVAKQNLKVGPFGTASGEFSVPSGRPLGTWSIRTSRGSGFTSLRVEEYKRPTFEAELSEAKEPFRLNQKAVVHGNARYYFGMPVTSGKVTWRVTRAEVIPWWWEFCGWWMGGSRKAAETVASGSSELKKDGSFSFDFLPEADERKAGQKHEGISYLFDVSADITDEGGETRSASRVFHLGFVAVEARLDWEEGFFRTGNGAALRANLSDLDGSPRKGKGEFRLSRLAAPTTPLPSELPLIREKQSTFDLPGDSQRARWETSFRWETITSAWKEEETILKGTVEHGEKGEGAIKVPPFKKGGVYRLFYQTKDSFGAHFEVSRDFLVAGPGFEGLHLPLLAVAEYSQRIPGQTASFLVHSGLPEQTLFLEVFRGGKRVSKLLKSGLIELPVSLEDRGGFTLSVHGLRDYQLLSATVNENVPWLDRQLRVDFASFRDQLRPAARETFRISVKGEKGDALEQGGAEILAYMYDRSLDLFGPHFVPPVLSIYPERSGFSGVSSSLGSAWAGGLIHSMPVGPYFPVLQPDRLNEYSSYGIGGPGLRALRFGGRASMMAEEGVSFSMARQNSAPGSLAPASAAMADQSAEGGNVSAKKAESASSSGRQEKGEPALRSQFSETAFFLPHLVTDGNGSASVEFTVPDSVTSWRVLAHALTKDLRFGSNSRETRSVKELMIRPYAPRFLREGDEAELRVQVNNAGDSSLSGELELQILDANSGESALALFSLEGSPKKTFKVEKGGSQTLSFPIKAPKKVGDFAFQVVGKAGAFSDGERRPFPVLPGRIHLTQSRFVSLHNQDEKNLVFSDMTKKDDPSRVEDRLVVTVDGQLFYGVLQALPYLVQYPYECVEQTMNRFLSTGILTSLFAKYPSVAKMAAEFSSRGTQLERFDQADPNRSMLLEETPWLQEAQGGKPGPDPILNILKPENAKAERELALQKIRKMQLNNGAFPWFQGGAPDEHMTLYVLMGFSRALEFRVELPKDLVTKAWGFVRTWLDERLSRMLKGDHGWETVTLVNFALSSYPDPSWTGGSFDQAYRQKLLDFSFKHWKEHSPLLKGYLALTLHRMGRTKDARLVWESVMDSAKHDPNLGTFWAREDRSWLWYNDTIETHAFALRTQMELNHESKHNEGMVQWLFLNKKLNHWKSTRATAEVLYALTHYLDRTAQLGVKESIKVSLGNQSTEFQFDPGSYSGKKNQILIPGDKIDPASMSKIRVSKSSPGFAFASATWHFSSEKLPQEERGDFFEVSRKYFRRELSGKEWRLAPLSEGARISVGDQIEVHLSLRSKHEAEYVHLRDPRGAGFEPENLRSGWRGNLGISWYEEIRDSGANFFFSRLPVGEYEFKYRVRANMAGVFRVGPATVQSMYAPEFNAYSSGHVLTVRDGKDN